MISSFLYLSKFDAELREPPVVVSVSRQVFMVSPGFIGFDCPKLADSDCSTRRLDLDVTRTQSARAILFFAHRASFKAQEMARLPFTELETLAERRLGCGQLMMKRPDSSCRMEFDIASSALGQIHAGCTRLPRIVRNGRLW